MLFKHFFRTLKTRQVFNIHTTIYMQDYIYEYRFKVRDYELDAEGIVNNANYLHYLEMTRHEFCLHAGISFSAMQAQGIIPVLSRVEIDYLTPLRSDDEVVSKLKLSRKGPRFMFIQDLFRVADNQQVCHAVVSCVTLENGKLSRGETLANLFADYL